MSEDRFAREESEYYNDQSQYFRQSEDGIDEDYLDTPPRALPNKGSGRRVAKTGTPRGGHY